MILNLSESFAKPLVMAKLNMAYLSSLNKRAKLLSSYLPVSPSRVLRAPGTSPYHFVPKHLRCHLWPRPEQSHLLPEALLSNLTSVHRQETTTPEHQTCTSVHFRPNPAITCLSRLSCALYDVEHTHIYQV